MSEPRRIVFDELRSISVVACVLLVALRLCIGWQFLYEGLWKFDTLDTAHPWTAAGYLKSAHGPFRDTFRSMTGDPDDLNWLDQEWVATNWDNWADRFAKHYRLNDKQQDRLQQLLTGPDDFRAVLTALPADVAVPKQYEDFVRFDPALKRIIVDGKKHLSAVERDRLLKLVKYPASEDDENRAQWELIRAYEKAIQDVYQRATRLSFKERLAVALGQADPERSRLVFANFKGTLGEPPEKIDAYYRELLAAYDANLDKAKQTGLEFQQQHLEREWKELQELRTELIGPIKALDTELKTEARKLLTKDQLALGPPSEPWTDQKIVDWLTIGALIVLGVLLIAGLATRAAAIAGAGMLLSFYLVWPPWPGVAEAIGSTEHSFIVNKNLIEVVALLALAALPSGQWFGLDRLFSMGWRRVRGWRTTRPASKTPAKLKESTVVTAGT